jgi:hypothetical protein
MSHIRVRNLKRGMTVFECEAGINIQLIVTRSARPVQENTFAMGRLQLNEKL